MKECCDIKVAMGGKFKVKPAFQLHVISYIHVGRRQRICDLGDSRIQLKTVLGVSNFPERKWASYAPMAASDVESEPQISHGDRRWVFFRLCDCPF